VLTAIVMALAYRFRLPSEKVRTYLAIEDPEDAPPGAEAAPAH
jgi:hypothetical protein